MKTIIISLIILLGGYTTYNEAALLTPPSKNITNFSNSTLEHTSDKCDVYNVPVSNTKRLDGSVYVIVLKKNQMNFKVSSKNETSNDFYMNSNFFANGPIGEVKIDGETKNRKKLGGGFFTSNGNSPKLYFNSRPNSVKYSSQTHLIGIKNGVINNRICKQKWARLKTYRILIGKDKKNNVIVVHSGNGGFQTIKDVCKIGVKYGIVNGLLFDGGSSVDVGLKDGFYSHTFQSVSTISKKLVGIHKPYTYIIGNFN
jgi:hypothetical protein